MEFHVFVLFALVPPLPVVLCVCDFRDFSGAGFCPSQFSPPICIPSSRSLSKQPPLCLSELKPRQSGFIPKVRTLLRQNEPCRPRRVRCQTFRICFAARSRLGWRAIRLPLQKSCSFMLLAGGAPRGTPTQTILCTASRRNMEGKLVRICRFGL